MATYEDARLIIEFSNWADDWGFHPANNWVRKNRQNVETYEVFSENCPLSSDEYKHVQTVLGFYENLGLFYKHDVIDRDLLFDWLDFVQPWSVLSNVALGLRNEPDASPTVWTNFELLAKAQLSWRDAKGGAPVQ